MEPEADESPSPGDREEDVQQAQKQASGVDEQEKEEKKETAVNGKDHWRHQLLTLLIEQKDVEKQLVHLYKPPHGLQPAKPQGFRTFGNVALVAEANAEKTAVGSTVDWVLEIGALHDKLETGYRGEVGHLRKNTAAFASKLRAGKAELDHLLSKVGSGGSSSSSVGAGMRRGSVSSLATGAVGAGASRSYDPEKALQNLSNTFDSLAAGLLSWKETQKHAYANLMSQAAELEREVLQCAEDFAEWESNDRRAEEEDKTTAPASADYDDKDEAASGKPAEEVGSGAAAPTTTTATAVPAAMASALSSLKAKTTKAPAAIIDARRQSSSAATAGTTATTTPLKEVEDEDTLQTRPARKAPASPAAALPAKAEAAGPVSATAPAPAIATATGTESAVPAASSPKIAALLSELKAASDKCAGIAASVKAVEKGMASKGGDSGGWPKDDHATFLSAWVAFTTSQFGVSAAASSAPLPEVKVVKGAGAAAAGVAPPPVPPAGPTSTVGPAAAGIGALPRPDGDAVTTFAARLVATQLPLQTPSSVRDHVDWWQWHQEQLNKRRELLALWRAAKLDEESVKRRLARAREEEAEELERGGKRKGAGGNGSSAADAPKTSSPNTRAAIVEWRTKKALEEAAKKRQEEEEKAMAAEMAAAKAALWRERREKELDEWKRRQATIAKKTAKKEGGVDRRRRDGHGDGDDDDDDDDSRDAASYGDYRDHLATPAVELAARAAEAMKVAKEKRAKILALQQAAEEAKKRRFGDFDDGDGDGDGDGDVGEGGAEHEYHDARLMMDDGGFMMAKEARRPPIPGLLPAHVRQFLGPPSSFSPSSSPSPSTAPAGPAGGVGHHKPKLSKGTRSTYAYVPHDPTTSTAAHEARATTSHALGQAHVTRQQAPAHEQPVASLQPSVKGRSFTFGVSAAQRPMKAVPAWRKGVPR